MFGECCADEQCYYGQCAFWKNQSRCICSEGQLVDITNPRQPICGSPSLLPPPSTG